MKAIRKLQNAAALPFVLLLVALNVTVIVALLIYATTELQASRNSVQAEAARGLAQSGIDLAASLIAANSTNNGFVTYQRVTNVGGAWRLETRIANVAAPDPARPWKRVATNSAPLHSGFATGTNGVDLNFAVRGDPTAGFIAPRTNLDGWQNLSPEMFRMEWIYVYKGNTNDPKNLVGRFAYWVDDESSKLNVNYSGLAESYSSYKQNDYKADIKLPSTIRAFTNGLTVPSDSRMGRIYPLDMELGGIAGLSTTNAVTIITKRGSPLSNNPAMSPNPFQPYPSVLGVRLATIPPAIGGLAITNVARQSELGFTATIYSREDERTYARGTRRFDLLRFPRDQSLAQRDMADGMPLFIDTILKNYPDFDSKYDIPAFAMAGFGVTTPPNFYAGINDFRHPAANYETSQLAPYSRGMPLVNEVSFTAVASNTSGTNATAVDVGVEFIVLQRTEIGTDYGRFWAMALDKTNSLSVAVELPGAALPLVYAVPTNSWTMTPALNATKNATNTWFTSWSSKNGTKYSGPDPYANNFTSAVGYLSFSTNYTNAANPFGGPNPPPTNFPTRAKVTASYGGKAYQTFEVDLGATNFPAPADGSQSVYQFIAQPRGSDGYRGDPRFINSPDLFTRYVAAVPGSTHSGLTGSLGTLNTNAVAGGNPDWGMDNFGSDVNRPDLVFSEKFASDAGLWREMTAFVHSGIIRSGLNGVGPIGEIPVTTPTGSQRLAFSTPRLWGDGRVFPGHPEYPPDWLLLDNFHLSISPTNSSGAFPSYGRVNVNSAKPFFQVMRGSTDRGDTVMDSVIVGTLTKDWMDGAGEGGAGKVWGHDFTAILATDPSRTNLLVRIKQMTEARNATNNPYTTHYEFLADLAATNISGNPGWWFAPDPATGGGDIYAATNTTDRRIEGVIRSLNQKFTTHGNQFSIFSLGQALQVVNGKTNVVGEAYLQSVYERAPLYNEATGAITNSPSGAPPMRQLFLRELRY